MVTCWAAFGCWQVIHIRAELSDDKPQNHEGVDTKFEGGGMRACVDFSSVDVGCYRRRVLEGVLKRDVLTVAVRHQELSR